MNDLSSVMSSPSKESRTGRRLRPASSPARIRLMRSATSSWRSSVKTIRAGRRQTR
jgi:hypothetical protein